MGHGFGRVTCEGGTPSRASGSGRERHALQKHAVDAGDRRVSSQAAWHPDPSGQPGMLRWWDGTQWTAHTQPIPQTVPAAGPSSYHPGDGQGHPGGARNIGQDAADEGSWRERRKQSSLVREIEELTAKLGLLRQQVVAAEDDVVLQEIGIYRYHHPAQDSLQLKDRLASIKGQYTAGARAGHAITATSNWTVDGSRSKGAKMVGDLSKLMLRAYNAEAEAAVKNLKPHKLDAAVKRLTTAAEQISRLGRTMSIAITPEYHRLRVMELELTADYLAMKDAEREAEREHKAELREQRKVEQEIKRAREAAEAKLAKERSHYDNLLARTDDPDAVAEAQRAIAEIEASLAGLEQRAANIRAGYVYVISNLGSFGPGVVKIGMTRRLEPLDRVRELGDASVPFRYDVHALVWSDDAVTLETRLHQHFADRRLNRINLRREFFLATPVEVRDAFAHVGNAALLEFTDAPEAEEWRLSGEPVATPINPATEALASVDGGP